MRPAARIQAAIDVLGEVLDRHRPASAALADWGKSHRFAGSGDRSAIGNIVFDALRLRASAGALMGSGAARAVVIGSLLRSGAMDGPAVAAAFDGGPHAPAALSPAERARIDAAPALALDAAAAAEVPAWIYPRLLVMFGPATGDVGRALAARAPVDVRVNTLKAAPDAVAAALARHGATATRWSRLGLRMTASGPTGRTPNVEAELQHGLGWFEVQDEGSQIAAALTGVKAGETVLDLCAGAGGKTLALAAAMQNQGRLVATDADKVRLRPIVERLQRSGATCVSAMATDELAQQPEHAAGFACVLVDAPCTGSGTWRRKPDAKWRLKPQTIAKRQAEQRAVLDVAAGRVRPGGRLVYVTCSILAEENTAQIEAFTARHPDFAVVPWRTAWQQASAGTLAAAPEASSDGREDGLLLTPHHHGTDGFYVCVLTRASA